MDDIIQKIIKKNIYVNVSGIKLKKDAYDIFFKDDKVNYLFIKSILFNEKIYHEVDSSLNFLLDVSISYNNKSIKITKKDLLNAINDGISNNIFSKDELEILKTLIDKLSFDFYKKSKIDSKLINSDYSYDEVFKLMELPEEEFIKKVEAGYLDYCYLIVKLFEKDRLINEYYLDQNIINNYKYISNKVKDYVYFKAAIGYVDKVNLDQKLEKDIIESIPNNITKIQKVIFIYYRLCQIFSYNEELYAIGKYEEEKKYNTNYISNINYKNNKIACFEFNTIFAKFLYNMGIEFKIIGDDGIYAKDGNHTYVNFKINNILYSADSTRGVFNCDLSKAKNNIYIDGIKVVKPDNKDTIDNLNKDIIYIGNYIFNKYKFSNNIDIDKINSDIEWLSMNSRLKYLINVLCSDKTYIMDKLNLNCKLCDMILENYGKLIIMNDLDSDGNIPVTIQVLVYNSNGNLRDTFTNEYYIIENDKLIGKLNIYEINKLIEIDKYKVIKIYDEYGVPASGKNRIKCKVHNLVHKR